jgi:hypothetical protein
MRTGWLLPHITQKVCSCPSRPYDVIFSENSERRIFLADWKEAQVKALLKKCDKSWPGNYRPVTLTNAVCKLGNGICFEDRSIIWLLIISYQSASMAQLRVDPAPLTSCLLWMNGPACWTKKNQYMQRTLISRSLKTTVEFGDGRIVLWGCYSSAGPGELETIEERMNSETYRCILLVKPAKKLNLPRGWIFLQDNDRKHTARATFARFQEGHWVIGMAKPITWPQSDLKSVAGIEAEGTGERSKKPNPIDRNVQGREG